MPRGCWSVLRPPLRPTRVAPTSGAHGEAGAGQGSFRVYCKRATAGTPFPDPQTWGFRPAQPLPKRRHPLHRAAAAERLSSASFPRTVIGWASPSGREEQTLLRSFLT